VATAKINRDEESNHLDRIEAQEEGAPYTCRTKTLKKARDGDCFTGHKRCTKEERIFEFSIR